MPLTDIQTQIERLASKVLDRTVRDALIALLPIFELKEVQDMATIQEALADLDGAVKGVAQRQADDHKSLQDQIDALQAQGVDTSALQAAADSIESNVAALNAIAVPVPSDPTAPVEDPTSPAPSTDGGSTPPADPAPADPAPADPAPADPAPSDPAAPVDPTVPADPAPADPAAPAPDAGGSSDTSGTVSTDPAAADGGLSAG